MNQNLRGMKRRKQDRTASQTEQRRKNVSRLCVHLVFRETMSCYCMATEKTKCEMVCRLWTSKHGVCFPGFATLVGSSSSFDAGFMVLASRFWLHGRRAGGADGSFRLEHAQESDNSDHVPLSIFDIIQKGSVRLALPSSLVSDSTTSRISHADTAANTLSLSLVFLSHPSLLSANEPSSSSLHVHVSFPAKQNKITFARFSCDNQMWFLLSLSKSFASTSHSR